MELLVENIGGDLPEIKKKRDRAIDFVSEYIDDEDFIFKIKLVVDELLTNSFRHGNKEDITKNIDLVLVIDKNSCIVKVKDEGEGFNYYKRPASLEDHGRGIKLVYSLSEDLLIKDNLVIAELVRDEK